MKTKYEHVQFIQLRADFGWLCVAAHKEYGFGIISRDKATDEYLFAANDEILLSAAILADIQEFMAKLGNRK